MQYNEGLGAEVLTRGRSAREAAGTHVTSFGLSQGNNESGWEGTAAKRRSR